MKTDRLTLLIAPADKAAITARADGLGLSVSELVRRSALAYDPEEEAARREVEALMPEFGRALDNIHASFGRMIARLDEGERRRAYQDTPEYREEVRRQVLADPSIDWDWIATLVGHDAPDHEAAA